MDRLNGHWMRLTSKACVASFQRIRDHGITLSGICTYGVTSIIVAPQKIEFRIVGSSRCREFTLFNQTIGAVLSYKGGDH
ncbi:hypothetical protein DICVIV_03865 [Dictyocaulus viviparus]|uniref:Uncharacterized protein n=1 Tax=Dictyocaulus viviparus TaxID=29172 RepID=A0A0D8Y1F6_DICVI|nr:hypothetical protein DICVIV_03865 [Dictyocaulus viviparus]